MFFMVAILQHAGGDHRVKESEGSETGPKTLHFLSAALVLQRDIRQTATSQKREDKAPDFVY
jgi:hypothetical protein